MRAAFYYGWYPDHWTSAGHHWNALLGEYDSGDPRIVSSHIDMLKYANIEAGIYSWWGQGTQTDQRFPLHLSTSASKGDFPWCIYYEKDYAGAISYYEVANDLSYLRSKYFSDPNYLRIGGRPVIFVYNPLATVATAAKWSRIRSTFGVYVSLDDYPDWWTANPVDSWHSYKPDQRDRAVYLNDHVYSIAVSAGFWSAAEATPRLDRDFTAWSNGLQAWNTYKPDWQLVYFNEFGEGTNIEPSNACCTQTLCGDYLLSLRSI